MMNEEAMKCGCEELAMCLWSWSTSALNLYRVGLRDAARRFALPSFQLEDDSHNADAAFQCHSICVLDTSPALYPSVTPIPDARNAIRTTLWTRGWSYRN